MTWWTTYTQQQWDNGILVYKSHIITDRKYMISPTDKWKKQSNNSHRSTDRKYMISPTDKWKKRSNNSHRTTDRKYIIFATNEMEDTIRQHLHSHRNKISDKRQLTIAGQLRKLPLNKWSKRYGNSDKKASKNFEVREHSPKCNYSYSPFNYNPSEHVI